MTIRLVIYWILVISKKNYKLVAIDLSKQTLQHLQQINFIVKPLKNTGATMFFINEKSEEKSFKFSHSYVTIIIHNHNSVIMETQKIVNLLNGFDNENWYVIGNESKGIYSHNDPIKLLTKSLESSLYDCSDVYILVTGNIRATPSNAVTQVVFKNCAPFKNCRTEINDIFIDNEDFINITMHMYNLIEHSDNYSDTSGSLWSFKRDEIVNNADVTNDNNSPSSKYKASIIGNTDKN